MLSSTSGGNAGCRFSERPDGRSGCPIWDRSGGPPSPFVLGTPMKQEGGMGLTGKFKFCKKLWGKIVLQVEEEVKPFWSKAGALKRRWRDAAMMDLASPEMRHLIDLQFKPHLYARSIASEGASAPGGLHGAEAGAARLNEEVRRIAH